MRLKFWRRGQIQVDHTTNDESAVASPKSVGRPPYGLKWRSSTPFIALTVGLGVLVDLAGYGLVVPVIPFRLEALGYDEVGSKTGWLVAAYAGGLIVSSPPIAYIGGRIRGKQIPLIIALLAMAGGILLFMFTESYTALVISRVLQGISGTGIWTLGLAMIVDSVPEARIGVVMGWVMIGFSIGQLIGPPVGGVLYERLGYEAPFVFGLILVAIDMLLRLLIVEKHVALKYIEAGLIDIPNFEAPNLLLGAAKEKFTKAEGADKDHAADEAAQGVTSDKADSRDDEKSKKDEDAPNAWHALLKMCTTWRPLTLFLLTALNGVTLGGLLDSGMTLNLEEVYGLNSLGAGLCFFALIIPTIFASPLAGWICDRYSAKGIATLGLLLSIPAYPLLIINGPLPLFLFFLVVLGTSMAFFLTPVSQDLSVVVGEIKGLPSTYAYGCFNMCYSIGSFVGPIACGQMIESLGVRTGWMAMCVLCAGLSAVLLPAVVTFVGGPLKQDKMWQRAMSKADGRRETERTSGGVNREPDLREEGVEMHGA